MTPLSEESLRHHIHMEMLKLSESAKDCGELTVLPLGHAVTIAQRLIETERQAWGEERALIERRQEVYQIWVHAANAHHKGLVTRKHWGYIEYLYRRYNELTDILQESTGSTKYVHYDIDRVTGLPIDMPIEQRNTSEKPEEHIHTNIIIDWEYTGDGDHGYGKCGDCGEKLSGFLVTNADREQRNTSGRKPQNG